MTTYTEEPIASPVRADTFPPMTHRSPLDRRFSALALALLKASDADPDIRSVRLRVLHALDREMPAPPRPLVEDLLISASALFLGIHPRPGELLNHWDAVDVDRAISQVTDALHHLAT